MPPIVVLIAETTSAFAKALQKNYETHTARSGKQGIALVQTYQADLIVLDAISLKTSGERICKRLRKAFPQCHIIHLHTRSKTPRNSQADKVLQAPLSTRRLINTIEQITLQKQPDFLLRCGPFVLDIERNLLWVNGAEVRLTPKQSALIEVFLRNPNRILDRSWLMQQVWDTTYDGDTRTLSVHIRFIRKVMEVDASMPRFIQTVRGIGYKLALEENKKTDQ